MARSGESQRRADPITGGGRVLEDCTLGNANLTTSPRDSAATSTVVFLVGLAITYLIILSSQSAGAVFANAALGIGLSLAIATAIEATAGVRGLIRVDVLMLWALFGLTFLEFLFPQPELEDVVPADVAIRAVGVAILGFAGIAIGRHVTLWPQKTGRIIVADVTPRNIFTIFVLAAAFGYLHILWTVNFDLVEMFRQMSLPRFYQSWGRGKYGDAYALLVEMGALMYLIPPIMGLMVARHKEFSAVQILIAMIILSTTVYYAFSSGTRNVLAVYVFTFFGAYYLNKPKIKLWVAVVQGMVMLLLLLVVTSYMLEFRNVGLTDYSFSDDSSRSTLYIDRNIVVLAQLTNAFPAMHDFLGWEMPYTALVHPIPRALWPGKPEGLSISIESVVGVTQASISCTFIGEAYMMGGLIGVMLVAILFGAAAKLWNRVGQDQGSVFSQLLYASGFFCAAISMRSLQWTTVTMLPTLALWMYARMFLKQTRSRTQSTQG
jgi:oligosaccharide repeat unit polymerase